MDTFRRKIIGIIGDSKDAHPQLVAQIVPWIASQNFHLLTGARGGVMEEASRVFRLAREARGGTGLVIGILPNGKSENSWVEVLIRTHLPGGDAGSDYDRGRDPRSRNWIEVRTCDVLVALPGGGGTEAEIVLAIEHETPVILFGWRDSPLAKHQQQPSVNVLETQNAADVIAFIRDRSDPTVVVGKGGWKKSPRWPSREAWEHSGS